MDKSKLLVVGATLSACYLAFNDPHITAGGEMCYRKPPTKTGESFPSPAASSSLSESSPSLESDTSTFSGERA